MHYQPIHNSKQTVPSLQLQSAQDIEQAIGNLIDSLRRNPDARFSGAELYLVMLTIDRLEPPPHRPAPESLRRSNNIANFRSIICRFRYGGPPTSPATDLWMQNRRPPQWQQWESPQAVPAPDGVVEPFRWDLAIQRMGLAAADRLLKERGYRGRYARVSFYMNPLAEEYLHLVWCFHNVEVPGRPPGSEPVTIAINAATAQVVFDTMC